MVKRRTCGRTSQPGEPPPPETEKKGTVLEQESPPFLEVLLSFNPRQRTAARVCCKRSQLPAVEQVASPAEGIGRARRARELAEREQAGRRDDQVELAVGETVILLIFPLHPYSNA